ncbi:uncharacterized protein BO66DRAFT_396145 [Aspergillus aculeatinus CBS 121060]|uniref:Uncharacterized protein n=1 Tax=Aspergillus aculeatinus CBS 121060 TaxID=1448322 RepID=A0ACD1GT79_9EURO|nr:hypothetical protein BO66DRAFT_396145 [Aspergillus aculeatinus CBS 121060]RAH64484.1 hypothetical protein BO66DRAFT_396145 [Aspergillus aculeatinus CBS 121060]
MKASFLTALVLAACTVASPVGQPYARDGECTCQPNGGHGSGSGSGSEPLQPVPESESPAPSASLSPGGSPSGVPSFPGNPAPASSQPVTLPGFRPAPSATVPLAASSPNAEPSGQPSGLPGSTGSSDPSGPSGPSGPSNPSGPAGPGSSPGVSGGSQPSATVPSGPGSSTPGSTPSGSSSCESGHCHGTGHLIQDLGPQADRLLRVVGSGTEELLIQLSDPVADLLAGLGLVGLSQPVGSLLRSASSIGELVSDLGQPVDNLCIVTGKGLGFLLIELDHPVADLLRGLGLDALAQPVGNVLSDIGSSLKRRTDVSKPAGLLEELAPVVDCILQITGEDLKPLLIRLGNPVAQLLVNLGLNEAGRSVGQVIRSAASVGDLIANLGPVVDCLLTVVGEDGGLLLIKLDPDVAALVSGLGLPAIGVPVGTIVGELGNAL